MKMKMKMKFLAPFLVSVLTSTTSHATTRCPDPTTLLGHTMGEAQSLLQKQFPGGWSKSAPLCWSNYFNLAPKVPTASSSSIICGGSIPARRLQVLVLEDADQVTSVSYLLPLGVEREAWLTGLETLLGKLDATDEYPDSRPFKHRSEHAEPFWKYWARDRKFFIEATMPYEGDIMVTISDMQALNDQKEALSICFDGPATEKKN